MACPQLAPTLLLHVNQLLMVLVGGALVVAARARWDPSLYVPARELFPSEFRALAALLPALALALLLLAHLALVALRTRSLALRRALLYVYSACVCAAVCGQAAGGAWAAARGAAWARSAAAGELRRAAGLADELRPLLDRLAHWHPLPDHLNDLIQEAQQDLPINLHILKASCVVAVALQLVAALLALLAAIGTPAARPRARALSYTSLSCVTATTPLSLRKGEGGRFKPRAVYRNGRLVLVERPPEHTHDIVIHRTVGQL